MNTDTTAEIVALAAEFLSERPGVFVDVLELFDAVDDGRCSWRAFCTAVEAAVESGEPLTHSGRLVAHQENADLIGWIY